jgi:hypothetical protein
MTFSPFSIKTSAGLPSNTNAVTLALVISFAILWAIWIQPHTLALRHMALSLGSLLGLYLIVKNKSLMWSRAAIPIYLIGLLFLWVTFHLFFLSSKFDLQLDEYMTIWKRILWGAPFAIGLGIALGAKSHLPGAKGIKGSVEYSTVWWIFFAGMVAPTVVYLIRAALMFLASKYGWIMPQFAMLLPGGSSWHIAKMGYIFFCLCALAVACGQFTLLANQQSRLSSYFASIYAATILAVFFVFYLENAKNGFAYAIALCALMAVAILMKKGFRWNWRNIAIQIVTLSAVIFLLVQHVQRNDSWKTLFADVKVSMQIEKNDAWKDYGARGYPLNERGSIVNGTNYLRAAWAQVAIQLIAERPLGYGLLYQSFGHFAKEKWPNSIMDTSHSAWLDITLGIGIPGVLLILLAGGLALKNVSQHAPNIFGIAIFWALLSIFLLMITTEVARQVYIEALIFMILLATGIGMARSKRACKRDV